MLQSGKLQASHISSPESWQAAWTLSDDAQKRQEPCNDIAKQTLNPTTEP